ncbi:histidine ammonia-lyase [Candidatus Xianfuyuplasma coldseepsis]|uniref:Histidine ammonia-lyase n=1 Tax=Candidatus Xianfuyuplasma coldseepsis TaxID=2782163 RepID=A0A7L7KQE4_9MOLU|nr:histidine ammonia-lyase [Xianfuyuplasma coldseepsis]QMS84805.1 histidine ammonia-lyase [Xianfuyuplasma coldseepsis]
MVVLNGNGLQLETFIRIARFHEKVTIAKEQQELVQQANDFVQAVVESEKPVYGINTGFGKLSDVPINKKDTAKLQENLLKSHACGVGNPFSEEIVRGMMVLRVNALVRGHSGIRLEVLEKLVEMLNKNVIPVVFEQGSLGASGDLAPLSHMSLPLIGLGECFYKGKRMSTKEAFGKAMITPIPNLAAKEGLSLINGTQAMTSVGAIVIYDSIRLLKLANVSLSMTLEALQGIIDAYHERVHQVRGHIGQIEIAEAVRHHLRNSSNITHQGDLRVQDAYSLRCAPQVHGASWDAFTFIKDKVEIEMNAVTDNPIILTDEGIAISAGNFHGQPLALPFDYLGIALSELANISERRIERLVNPQLSEGLPAFLLKNPGLNSGFMIVQYSAASLVSENKVLAHPSSVDSIPSSANQEDHVSMGTIGARKAMSIYHNTRRVIAMEFLTAAQALDIRGFSSLGEDTKKAYQFIRQHIPFVEHDDIMYHYIHKMDDLLQSDQLYNAIFKEG